MPGFSRLLWPALRVLRAAATLGSAALAVGVLSVWAVSFRRPVTAAFDARGERCRVVVVGGRASVDNSPQVAAEVTIDRTARRARIDAAVARIRDAYKAVTRAHDAYEADVARRFDLPGRPFPPKPDSLDSASRAFVVERELSQAEIQRELNGRPAPPRPPWSRALPPYAPPLAAVLLAVPAALAVRRRLRFRYRWRTGRCVACGYDCRATPERCPECGAGSPAAA